MHRWKDQGQMPGMAPAELATDAERGQADQNGVGQQRKAQRIQNKGQKHRKPEDQIQTQERDKGRCAAREAGRDQGRKAHKGGMLAIEACAPPAVTSHLADQGRKVFAGVVPYRKLWAGIGIEARLLHAVVEFHILAGVEIFIHVADLLENLPPVCRAVGDRTGGSLVVAINERIRAMAKP
ncbi:hypothetical protein DSECCO2_557080 [anaerobic digester metagenome]